MQIDRFSIKDIDLGRIAEATARRVRDIPHAVEWIVGTPLAAENRRCLARFNNCHVEDRCFLIANGPSLRNMDLSPLRNEVTFGLNRIYLLADEIGFLPSYYVCINELVLEQYSDEIGKLKMPKFINWNRRGLFLPHGNNLFFLRVRLSIRDSFQMDIRKPIWSGGTVTYAALQIAYFMGFRKVIVIGLDHSYSEKGTPNRTKVRHQERDIDHFHPDYFPKGTKWQPPDLLRSEIAYSIAEEVYRDDGRTILDATIDGKCPIFPKVDYESLFV